jgi:hypothetical protein
VQNQPCSAVQEPTRSDRWETLSGKQSH